MFSQKGNKICILINFELPRTSLTKKIFIWIMQEYITNILAKYLFGQKCARLQILELIITSHAGFPIGLMLKQPEGGIFPHRNTDIDTVMINCISIFKNYIQSFTNYRYFYFNIPIFIFLCLSRPIWELIATRPLVDCCLTSSEQYFSYIEDENKLINTNN